jgi:hypothetical protein
MIIGARKAALRTGRTRPGAGDRQRRLWQLSHELACRRQRPGGEPRSDSPTAESVEILAAQIRLVHRRFE